MKIIITRRTETVREIFVDAKGGTKESVQELVALGINNLGFEAIGDLVSENIEDYVDDINVDSLD